MKFGKLKRQNCLRFLFSSLVEQQAAAVSPNPNADHATVHHRRRSRHRPPSSPITPLSTIDFDFPVFLSQSQHRRKVTVPPISPPPHRCSQSLLYATVAANLSSERPPHLSSVPPPLLSSAPLLRLFHRCASPPSVSTFHYHQVRYAKFAEKKKEVIFLMSLCKIISNTGQDFLLGSIGYSENGRFDLFDFFYL